MKFLGTVYEPMYDFNDKKYIRFIIPVKGFRNYRTNAYK
jgi:menaquinone-dependent protoporphyrinogen IX oxidase